MYVTYEVDGGSSYYKIVVSNKFCYPLQVELLHICQGPVYNKHTYRIVVANTQ